MKEWLVWGSVMGVLLLASGCSGQGVDADEAPPVHVTEVSKVQVKDYDDTVLFDVLLSDGTRCVVSDGPRSGGVDCDWEGNR